jgi:histone deacetylase 1/2
VKHKWIFEIKRNGVFRARLVACGYSQVPGVDFTETYAPVVNDIMVRILIIAMMLWKFNSILVDVETAFLHGVLKKGEEIYMDCSDGMDAKDDECLMLEKMIYGLVQSTRAYFKKCTAALKEIGFQQSAADPCLFIRKNELGIVYVAM